MDKIVITGIRGYDGEYDFDPSYFTNKELHKIKQMADVRAGEIEAAFAAGDNDLVVALAAVAIERAGKVVYEDALWNAKVGCIEFVAEQAAADADPPTPSSDGDSSAKNEPSGLTSDDVSVSQENGQSRTGIQASELSAASG